MTQADVEMGLQILGALVVLMTLVSNLPGVAKTKAGQVMHKAVGVDIVGLARLIMSIVAKPKE